jgi:putative FmdB family regulatory protein
MPTYEYECQACKRRVEAVQKFTDSPLTTCEFCGGELRKVFSAVGIVFKGSGFYKNDSRGTSSSATPPAAAPVASSPSESTPSAPKPSTSAAASSTAAD